MVISIAERTICFIFKGINTLFSTNAQHHLVATINNKTTIKAFYRSVSNKWQNFDINESGLHDWSLLQAACHHGNFALAQLFIKMGARVNHPRVDGCTALYDAINTGSLELVKLLVENGASIYLYCGNGTPIDYAKKMQQASIVDYLQTISQSFPFQPYETEKEAALRKEGANILHYPSSITQVQKAIEQNNLDVVDRLLSGRSVNLNVSSNRDMSPILVHVGKAGHFDMVKLLVKHGIMVCESYMQHTGQGLEPISVIESIRQANEEIAAYLENVHKERYRILEEFYIESKSNKNSKLTDNDACLFGKKK